jgi:hypothetical protein
MHHPLAPLDNPNTTCCCGTVRGPRRPPVAPLGVYGHKPGSNEGAPDEVRVRKPHLQIYRGPKDTSATSSARQPHRPVKSVNKAEGRSLLPKLKPMSLTPPQTTQESTVKLDMPELTPNDAPHAATATVEDEAVMLTLFAAAAKEPPESESSAHILGFESSVVEDCYDATHGPTRLLGCWVVSGVMILLVGARIATRATGNSLSANFGQWLAITCCFGLLAAILPAMLCRIQGGINANRHALRRTAYGTALITFIVCLFMNLSILTRSVSSLDSSGEARAPWDPTIRVGYIWGAGSVLLPMYMALLLRVNFPWVATAPVTFAIAYAAITKEHTSIFMYTNYAILAGIVIAMLYATEATSRQRFVSQIRLQRQVDEQKETIMKAAADKALASTKSFSQIVSATAHGDASPAVL